MVLSDLSRSRGKAFIRKDNESERRLRIRKEKSEDNYATMKSMTRIDEETEKARREKAKSV